MSSNTRLIEETAKKEIREAELAFQAGTLSVNSYFRTISYLEKCIEEDNE